MATSYVIRAQWILPIAGPPIENGEVVMEGDRIADVRPATDETGPHVRDFGDAIIMPGLVNVHTHLDYTLMRGLLEDIEFFPWIRELTARKTVLTPEDWVASATLGAAEAIAGGVTTIGDCTDSGAALWGAKAVGLGGVIFQEVFGIDERQTVETIVQELQAKVANLNSEAEGTRLTVGISPHSPYTVRAELLRALADYARTESLAVCIHAAESQPEAELLRGGTGPIAAMFARREIAWDAPGVSAVAYLDDCGLVGPKTLLVHGVQVSANDRHIVRERGVAWAHCPKSNAKLGVGVAPLGLLCDFGRGDAAYCNTGAARIGLGSDSVASNNTMDLFEEMRFAVLIHRAARRKINILSAKEAVEMATIGGARALGLESEIGTLEAGKRADLCVVGLNALHALPAYNPYNALVYAARAGDVLCTLIAGKTIYDCERGSQWQARFPRADLAPALQQFMQAAQKMREWEPTAV